MKYKIDKKELNEGGIPLLRSLKEAGFIESIQSGKDLIDAKKITINEATVKKKACFLTPDNFNDGICVLHVEGQKISVEIAA